jgi:RES domain-containing protein
MKAHPDHERIFKALQRFRDISIPWSGVIFRSTSPYHYSRAAILSGEGGARSGGRWNPIGIKAVYGSCTPETAMAETLQYFRYYQIPIEKAMPRLFVAIRVSVSRSLDLRDTDLLRTLGVSRQEILDTDWRFKISAGEESLTQAIGIGAFSIDIEALLVPAAAERTGTNAVIFPDILQPGSLFVVDSP